MGLDLKKDYSSAKSKISAYGTVIENKKNQALKQKENCSWRELVKTMGDVLKTSQYDQTPQFSSGLFENIAAQVFI